MLNYFNTFTGCTLGIGGGTTDCRGAESQGEFDRQYAKIVAALLSTGADVLGLSELENDGYGSSSAIQHLVDQLNAATAPGTWAFIDADAGTGQVNALGTDAIKVGLLYKPGVVTAIGTTAALNTVAFVNAGDSAPRNRPALAQAFEQNSNGGRLVVVVNHLKSKGSACNAPDTGDGQGNCAAVRTIAAQELAAWLNTNPTNTGIGEVLMLGDYNAYAKEDPIVALESAGFANLVPVFLGNDAYSYSFDGQWGSLDHALASSRLLWFVTGVADHHINADEPTVLDYNTNFKSAGQIASLFAPDAYRAADHDPVVVGLDLCKPIAGTDGRDALVGTAGGDCITGKLGADTLTGNGGPDLFVYNSIRDTGDTLIDFVPGTDLIDLSAMLRSLGFAGGNALTSGWVKVIPSGTTNSIVQIDQDGPGAAYVFRSFMVVRNVLPSNLAQASNFIF